MSNEPRRIFLGNLNYEASAEDVQSALAPFNIKFGEIRIPMDGDGRRKGFAFIDIAESETLEVEEIISMVDGVEILGRPCRAAKAKPQRGGHRGGKGGERGHHHGGRPGSKARQRYRDESPGGDW